MREYIIGFLVCWFLFGTILLISDVRDGGIKVKKTYLLIALSFPAFIPAAICALLYGLSWRYIYILIKKFRRTK